MCPHGFLILSRNSTCTTNIVQVGRTMGVSALCADWIIPSTTVLLSFGNLYYDALDITYGGPGF